MTVEQFRRFLRVRPFVPFAIELADRREIQVHHPENAMINGPGRTIAAVNRDKVIEIIDLLLVTSLRPLKSLRPLNGKPRRRGTKKPR
jgi:hypothetical protein